LAYQAGCTKGTVGALPARAASADVSRNAATFTSLYSFERSPDGADPTAGLAPSGGSYQNGTVFSTTL
jgi:hypothetical protein